MLSSERICNICLKGIRADKKGSVTGWIFEGANCECSIPQEVNSLSKFGDSETDDSSPTEFPQISERYRIEKLIARGGMAFVYKALDTHLDKQCVVKVLRYTFSGDQVQLQRFGQEARICAQFNHPNLLAVTDYGITDKNIPYLVMDFFDGWTLRSLINQTSKIKPTEIIGVIRKVCSALDYAHSKGIIHRDVKPENIIISNDAGNIDLKLIDFGIARLNYDGGEIQRLTQTGEIFGSAEYMSPEHCHGSELDERSDIYSTGCIFYELLTGNPPFRERGFLEVLQHHVSDKHIDPSTIRSDIKSPDLIDRVVSKCLEKNLADRYQNMQELITDLETISKQIDPSKKKSSFKLAASIIALIIIILLPISIAFQKQNKEQKSAKIAKTKSNNVENERKLLLSYFESKKIPFSKFGRIQAKEDYLKNLKKYQTSDYFLFHTTLLLDTDLPLKFHEKVFKLASPKLESITKKIKNGRQVSTFETLFAARNYYEMAVSQSYAATDSFMREKAKENYLKALKLIEGQDRFLGFQSNIHYGIGRLSYAEKNYKTAIKNLELALEEVNSYYIDNTNRTSRQSRIYFRLARTYLAVNDAKKAFFYANLLCKLRPDKDNIKLLKKCEKLLKEK